MRHGETLLGDPRGGVTPRSAAVRAQLPTARTPEFARARMAPAVRSESRPRASAPVGSIVLPGSSLPLAACCCHTDLVNTCPGHHPSHGWR